MSRSGPDQTAVDVKTKVCYYHGCQNQPKWAVRTEHSITPDGQPFHLYTCDDHCEELTSDRRRAKAKYLLRPIAEEPAKGSDIPPPPASDGAKQEQEDKVFLGRLPFPVRVLAAVAIGITCVLIAPFVAIFYIAKLAFGWKPPKDFNG